MLDSYAIGPASDLLDTYISQYITLEGSRGVSRGYRGVVEGSRGVSRGIEGYRGVVEGRVVEGLDVLLDVTRPWSQGFVGSRVEGRGVEG